MDVKIEILENALKAAKDLNLGCVPRRWIKLLYSGWQISPASCECGAKWAWMKPHPSGAVDQYGCVCHNQVSDIELLVLKNSDSVIVKMLLKSLEPKQEDVGGIFYTYIGKTEGEIVSLEKFNDLDKDLIGWWTNVTQDDVVD